MGGKAERPGPDRTCQNHRQSTNADWALNSMQSIKANWSLKSRSSVANGCWSLGLTIRRTILSQAFMKYNPTAVLVLVLLAAFGIQHSVVRAQFTVITNNNQITITAYTGPNGAVTIPDTINGLSFTTIAFQAFAGKGIISVILPSGLTTLGDEAFDACYSLPTVTIPASVTRFGNYVFVDCTSLTNCIFNGNAPVMGQGAFSITTSSFTVEYYAGAAG